MLGRGEQDGAMGNYSQRRWNWSLSLGDVWVQLRTAAEKGTSGSAEGVSKIREQERQAGRVRGDLRGQAHQREGDRSCRVVLEKAPWKEYGETTECHEGHGDGNEFGLEPYALHLSLPLP